MTENVLMRHIGDGWYNPEEEEATTEEVFYLVFIQFSNDVIGLDGVTFHFHTIFNKKKDTYNRVQ